MHTVTPIHVISNDDIIQTAQIIGGDRLVAWVSQSAFGTESGASYLLCPNVDGSLAYVLAILRAPSDMYGIAKLATSLPEGEYQLSFEHYHDSDDQNSLTENLALGWALAQYRYTRYKQDDTAQPVLSIAQDMQERVNRFRDATYLVRDLINTPPSDMGPEELVEAALQLGKDYKAKTTIIDGKKLQADYPAVYAVGKASARPPCYIDMRWGSRDAPRVTLVGKGVCFDTGGLDIKSSAGMRLMKKDMGGAAAVLGLAKLIMSHDLAVQLRVLVPAVENSVGGNAFRTSDVITMRNGMTVEIGNTDAEGRLILADALADASDEHPELLIDCATLTGAARVALGTDLPACFSNDDILAQDIVAHGKAQQDMLWQLPLHQPYAEKLKSSIADTNHISSGGYGGAITAALFLEKFVGKDISWLHIDMMAWNVSGKAGRPKGGEAMGIRALFAYLETRYGA